MKYKHSVVDLKRALANKLKDRLDIVDALVIADEAVDMGKSPDTLRASLGDEYCNILDIILLDAQE